MNYTRDINSADPLPTLGKKVQPELEDVKPDAVEQFNKGDHKPLEDVARGTVASSGDESKVTGSELGYWRHRVLSARLEEIGWDAAAEALLAVCDQRDNLQRLCDTQQARIAELELNRSEGPNQ